MKASVFMKTGNADAVYFLESLANANALTHIDVYRDSITSPIDRVTYHTNRVFKTGTLRIIERFIQALLQPRKPDVYIGVYEYPHGLLAFAMSKFAQKRFVLCVIGNPGYTKVRYGIKLRLIKIMFRYADAITVTGEQSKAIVVRMGINENKVFVLPNTIPIDRFRDINLDTKPYDIISLGRISPEKHIELIVEIVNRFKPRRKLKVAIAGSGNDLLRVRALVDAYDLNANIDFMGFVPDSNLETFFNSGKIFLLCSQTEGFPRTILQASSCGAFIISSAVGDIPQMIRHGENGYLVSPFNNIDMYCDLIDQVLENSEYRVSMAKQLQREIHCSFSTHSGSIVWSDIFNKLSSKRMVG